MFVILFVSLFVVYFFHELYWKCRNLPPGPIPLPIFGNLLDINRPPPGYEAFERWKKKFGDVFTFWIGPTPYIVITSYDKIKETFIREGDLYVDKKAQPMIDLFRGGEFGIIDSNGALWRDHRRFALSNLRDFGLGKNLMQEKILIEVEDLFKKFDKTEGTEVVVPDAFDNAIANVINQLLFGYRFDESRHDEFLQIKKIIDAPNEIFGKFYIFLVMNIPFLAKIIPKRFVLKLIEDFRDDSNGFFLKQIAEHRKKMDFEDPESSDYVECYLKEQRKRESEGDKESFCDLQLTNVCLDLWFAGLGTTTNTTSWAISYVLNTPGIQEKVHEELDRVIGSDRLVTTADKNDLPYMNAFINETQRCANIVPLNLQHATTRDTVINGYHIPKGTGVVAQIANVMLDGKTFPEPYKFNPDRFIEDGKLKKVEELVPFSVGKRQCLGEGLARMELFLFISNFFNRYTITCAKSGPPDLTKTCGNLIAPRVFSGTVKRRHVV